MALDTNVSRTKISNNVLPPLAEKSADGIAVTGLVDSAESSSIEDAPGTTTPPEKPALSRSRATLVVVSVGLMTMMGTTLSGVLAVALPTIAAAVQLDPGLLLWPASVYALTCGCTLLFFGSWADVLGARPVYLAGSALCSAAILACGLARTGSQLIAFRALQGVAISMCLPSSVSIITACFAPGTRRNAAFACLGGAQPTGFLIGLVVGGILTDTVGWRASFYLVAGINAAIFGITLACLPRGADEQHSLPWAARRSLIIRRFRSEVDWLGVLLLSTAFALLAYVLAAVTIDIAAIRTPSIIALLALGVLLLPAFVVWVHFQEKRGRPALIPNGLWQNRAFAALCTASFLAWATVTANQYFLALFFQKVQHVSAFGTSLRFLPLVVSGVGANIATGLLVKRVRADWLVAVSVALSAATPLIMALADPAWMYWAAAFPAAVLSPIAADVVLTVANLTITAVFPPNMHGLAGGVSNTLAQLGTSFGLNLTSILAAAVTVASTGASEASSGGSALEVGYRAAFWASFGATISMLGAVIVGMGKIGCVGRPKTD